MPANQPKPFRITASKEIARSHDPMKPEYAQSIEEMFSYQQHGHPAGEKLELEKAVRSAAYLLDYCSEAGNEALDGTLALGIAKVLYRCAKNIAFDRLRTIEDEKEETAHAS